MRNVQNIQSVTRNSVIFALTFHYVSTRIEYHDESRTKQHAAVGIKFEAQFTHILVVATFRRKHVLRDTW